MATQQQLESTKVAIDSEKSSTGAGISLEDVTRQGPVDLKNYDVALSLAAGHVDDPDLTPDESRRLRNKLDLHLLPLLFVIYCVQFIDKGTLASASILGIIQDNKLSQDEFNTLGSAFYIGFLAFNLPQAWALQVLPVGKWISFNVFLWCIFLGLHTVCHNFGVILRFLLGASESSITAGMMLVTSMFYTRTEIGERIGWTLQCNGIGTIISGFLSFGVFHVSEKATPNQWQWLMIITTIMTFAVFLLFIFWFPDNPTSANQNGIETKTWKRKQFMESFTDMKTWLFFFLAVVANLQNGIGVQYSLIIKSLGFTKLQTTLLNIPSGVTQIMGVTLGCYMLRRSPNSRAWIAILFWMPSILAALLQLFLPFSNKVGHLVQIYVLNFGGASSFVMSLSWVTSTSAGHTKRLTVNGIFLVGYSLGQILCTQFWKKQYQPRNLVPWGITLGSYFVCIALVLIIRAYLVAENKRRDDLQAAAEQSGKGLADFDELGYVDTVDGKGNQLRVRVDRSMLDATDRENLSFRYVL